MIFLNGIVYDSYVALFDVLMEDDSKNYEDCILALRKKPVDIEDNRKGKVPLRMVATLKQSLSTDEDEQGQQNMRYVPNELWDTFAPAQKKMYKAHLCSVKLFNAPTKQALIQYSSSSTVALVDTEPAALE